MSTVTMFRRLFNTNVRTIRHPKPVRRPRLAIQELELRSLMAATLTASLNVADGVLRVEGTDAADQIHVRHSGGTVRIDGIQIAVIDGAITTPAATVARDQITTIVVVALDGDDLVRMHDTLMAGEAPIPMAIHGDSGNDTLIGGDGADTISGGSGVDSILGGAGEDALYGDSGPAAAPAVLPAAASFYSGEGNANDSSGNNHGILHGDVGFSPGKVGQAFEFDGNLDYVDLGSDPTLDLPGSMSTSLWVRLDTLDNEKYFLADFITGGTSQGSLGTTGGAYWYQSYTDGTSDSATGVTPMQLNQWYHLSAVRDDVAKTLRLYVNGSEEANFSYAGKTVVSLQGSKILGGSNPNYPGDYIDGQLDEVGIYNRALSDAEVQSLYLAGNPGVSDDGAADTLKGEDGNDYLDGGAGDDFMLGGDGNDQVHGAAGDDAINGEAGADTLVGGDGNDVLRGGDGNDILKGGQEFSAVEINGADDKIYGEAGSDQIWGGDGNDTLVGGNNRDALYGERGDDILKGAQEFNATEGIIGADPLTWPDDLEDGGPGADQIWGGDGNDTLVGGDGRDALYGERGDDILRGAQGNSDFEGGITVDPATWPDDLLDGGAGDDKVYGGDGRDQLFGGAANDTLVGGNGNDVAHGGAGNDVLKGAQEFSAIEIGGADDKLYGEAGSDQIWGGDGNDTLVGGNGHDSLFGEDGNDIMKGANEFNANETLGDNYDYMLGGRGSDQMWGGDGSDTLVGGDGRDAMDGEGGNDTMKGADEFSAVETVGDNSDYMLGGPGHDAMWGGDGMDTLVGGDGHDSLYGEGGNDTMKGADEFNAHEDFGNDYDYMLGGPGNDAMWGGNGNDTLVGGDGFDGLYGENGADILKGAQEFSAQEFGGAADLLDGGNGNDTIWGGDGDDALYGGPEGDTLYGEAGNDGLFGGAGTNFLYGGTEADRFLTWTGGTDTVMDPVWNDARIQFNDTTKVTNRNSNEVDAAGKPIECPLRYKAAVWTDAEIRIVDGGLDFDHKLTGNTRMLKPATGHDNQEYSTQVFSREGVYIPWTAAETKDNVPKQVANVRGLVYNGWNGATGIVINTYGVNAGAESMQVTVVHELAHNWDTESAVWNTWQAASGWTNTQPPADQMANFTVSGDGRWWFANTASNTFYRPYGQFNALEDWTTTWEAFRLNRLGRLDAATAARMAGKFAIVNSFVSQISGP
jgi:Ca2+-binding RTX toxin-like protein